MARSGPVEERNEMQYTMKDLGYKRTPTDAMLRVEMEDGSKWDVPVQVIADSRDEHYADEQEDTVGFIRAGGLTDYEIKDWAAGNMNWSDVQECATKADLPPRKIDWQEGWTNGAKKVIGTI
jgi:hypothetical protein